MTTQQVTSILTIQPRLITVGGSRFWRISDTSRPVGMAGANSVAIDGLVISAQNLGSVELLCLLQGSADRVVWGDIVVVAELTEVGPFVYQQSGVGFDFVRLWYQFDIVGADPTSLSAIIAANPSCQVSASIRTLLL